jgi:hypothetical protein
MSPKTKKQLTWIISNTIYATLLYAGVVMEIEGVARVFLLLFWMNFILIFATLLTAEKLSEVSEQMATEGFPRWVHFVFDLSCAVVLAYFDWIWIAAFTMIEHFAWVSMVDELRKRKAAIEKLAAKLSGETTP